MSYRIEFDMKVISKIDTGCSHKDRAWTTFNEFVYALDFKTKRYKNGLFKVWLSKTDYKYTKPFLSSLSFESIPFEVIKLK